MTYPPHLNKILDDVQRGARRDLQRRHRRRAAVGIGVACLTLVTAALGTFSLPGRSGTEIAMADVAKRATKALAGPGNLFEHIKTESATYDRAGQKQLGPESVEEVWGTATHSRLIYQDSHDQSESGCEYGQMTYFQGGKIYRDQDAIDAARTRREQHGVDELGDTACNASRFAPGARELAQIDTESPAKVVFENGRKAYAVEHNFRGNRNDVKTIWSIDAETFVPIVARARNTPHPGDEKQFPRRLFVTRFVTFERFSASSPMARLATLTGAHPDAPVDSSAEGLKTIDRQID